MRIDDSFARRTKPGFYRAERLTPVDAQIAQQAIA
jgi:hypothetical protein